MPTVDCDLTDCRKHGREICIDRRITIRQGRVQCYDPVVTARDLRTFNPHCKPGPGGYKSDRVTGILK